MSSSSTEQATGMKISVVQGLKTPKVRGTNSINLRIFFFRCNIDLDFEWGGDEMRANEPLKWLWNTTWMKCRSFSFWRRHTDCMQCLETFLLCFVCGRAQYYATLSITLILCINWVTLSWLSFSTVIWPNSSCEITFFFAVCVLWYLRNNSATRQLLLNIFS